MSKEQIISPVSIDLGAKNTGVYFAQYPAGSSIEDIEKEGKVYQLERDSYTLLMASRTAKRHQRRGYDRRQMVKRLFKLIWEKHFGLEWDKNVQQTTSFLFNRRGFSFLTEEYNAEILRHFPEEAYQELPEVLQTDTNDPGKYDFAGALTEWANEGEVKTRSMFDAINEKPKQIRNRLFFIGKTTKLKEYCEKRLNAKIPGEKKKNLENLSRWVWDEWLRSGVDGLDEAFVAKDQNNGSEIEWKNPTAFNLVTYLNQRPEVASRILRSLPNTSEENKLKNSVWNFKAENFKLEDKDFTPPEPPDENSTRKEREGYERAVLAWKQLHLQHLTFALQKTLNELQSGGRHRRKYFQEVKTVLKNQNHTHGYLKEFCGKLQSGIKPQNSASSLTDDSLANLISHLSNLELKPLRKYFNDEKHKEDDYWDELRLNKIFNRWIISEWRINPEKDKQKLEGTRGDYKKLCKYWEEHNGSIVDFLLTTDPFFTIPPYQDNNNRRPPRCQSLVLNPTFLDNCYPAWQTWLTELKNVESVQEHLADYEKELQNLKGGKGRSYFSDNLEGKRKTQSGRRTSSDLDARILQFIFDRVKADDPMKLNEIYSHAKKYRQLQSTQDERRNAKDRLEKIIERSELPDILKTPRDYQNSAVFEQGNFLHLTCKYYKIRQKARDGRVFIHPEYRYVKGRGYEDTGRFDDKDHLLTYCNYKPRQKRYQILGDLAGLLQVSPRKLEDVVAKQKGKTTDEKLFNWLSGIDNLKTNCDTAAKQQKKRRGHLKLDIQKVSGLIYHRRQSKSPSDKEIKEILKDSKVDEADKLYRFCKRAKNLCLTITQCLYDKSRQQQWQEELERNPATAVYLLAQLNNIAFKERNGNAKTCAVCSIDNAQRMLMITSEGIKESHARAQRLPAIETRLIDGAVMRMARIVGGAIAKDKWKKIESELETGKRVRVPIITESNRFEFEPSLKEIKGKKLSNIENKSRSDGQKDLSSSKKERIQKASLNVCPYTGKELGDTGDKDHIIPRSSEHGTLNDEANLIWASDRGNKKIKKDSEFSLQNLKDQYKSRQFGTVNNHEIENWIIEQIGDGEVENFKFGPYRSFINLNPEQQKAFRHALFLVGHPLRKQVINAIDNRTRTVVNGTQRYFTQVLADNLHKKAKTIKKQHLLSFDFFGVEAQDNTRGDGIYDLRAAYEETDNEVFKFAKQEGKKQQAYSHLIDAQLAFAMVADAHKNDGGLKLEIGDSCSLRPADKDTGEIFDKTIFDAIRVIPENMQRKELKRRKVYTVETHHREVIAKNKKPPINYQIHRDSIFKESFFPLLKFKNGTIKKGFNQSNSVGYNSDDFSLLRGNDFIHRTSRNDQYEVWNIRKKKSQQFLMRIGTLGASSQELKIAKIIDKLTYQTIKKPLEKVLDTSAQKNQPPKTVGEALERWDKCIKEEGFKKDKILLPAYHEWRKLRRCLLEESAEGNFLAFVKNCSLFTNNQSTNNHNKVRKVFSLPVKSDVGSIRLQRNSWDKSHTVQVVAEESLAKYGYDGKDRPHTILSPRSVPRKYYTGIPNRWNLEPIEWKTVPSKELRTVKNNQCNCRIINAQIKHKDADRCEVRLTVSSIQNLSLPQERSDWKGKVLCHENDEKLAEAQNRDKKGNHHCLSSQWKWFEKPFALPQDRREVEIETNPDGKVIYFTVSKSNTLRKWLLGKET